MGTEFNHRRDASETQNKVPFELKEGLVVVVSEAEIWKALISIHRDKAPGPNGYNSAFFQDKWSIVKEDLIAGMLSFFAIGFICLRVGTLLE